MCELMINMNDIFVIHAVCYQLKQLTEKAT